MKKSNKKTQPVKEKKPVEQSQPNQPNQPVANDKKVEEVNRKC